jgi:hypothetical protein
MFDSKASSSHFERFSSVQAARLLPHSSPLLLTYPLYSLFDHNAAIRNYSQYQTRVVKALKPETHLKYVKNLVLSLRDKYSIKKYSLLILFRE